MKPARGKKRQERRFAAIRAEQTRRALRAAGIPSGPPMGERGRARRARPARRHRAPPLAVLMALLSFLLAARTGPAPLRAALTAATSAAGAVVAPARALASALQQAGTAAASAELQEAELAENEAYMLNGSFPRGSPLRGVRAQLLAGGQAVLLTSSMGGSCAGLLLIPTRLSSPVDGSLGPATRSLRGASAGCG